MDKNISANLTGFLTTFLVISDGFLGLRYRKKSYDNSPDDVDLNIEGGGSE